MAHSLGKWWIGLVVSCAEPHAEFAGCGEMFALEAEDMPQVHRFGYNPAVICPGCHSLVFYDETDWSMMRQAQIAKAVNGGDRE